MNRQAQVRRFCYECVYEAFSAFYSGIKNRFALTIKARCDAMISKKRRLAMMNLSAARELMYWHSNADWYVLDEVKGYIIKDDAPEGAQDSFRKWREQRDKE